jgi:hypothetical protein
MCSTVHHHAAGAVVAAKEWGVKGGLTTKIHLAVDAHENPIRIKITEGTTADCKQFP